MHESEAFNGHLTRIMDALLDYSQTNHRLAVDEPADDFERAVNAWAAQHELLKELKGLLKPLETEEKGKRDAIAASLAAYFGDKLKVGVNNYELSNHRKLKYTHKQTTAVEASMVSVAREAYKVANEDKVVAAFDDLLRVKYELAAAPYKKLDEDSKKAVSRMVVTKPASCVLEVD